MYDEVDLDALAELQAANLRADYGLFCEAALAPFGQRPARHHRVMIKHLQDVADGKTRRLLIMMPPGSAKSTYSSILFPPWLMAQKSVDCVITASANADLATGFLGKAFRVATSMKEALGYDFAQARVDYWRTTNGDKELRSFGAKADTAGRRADVALIDDPIGSWKDANSDVERNQIWDWYRGDIINRLKPGGRVVLIMTHWHQDDPAGRVLEAMRAGGEQWTVVSMQAIYDGTDPDPLGREIGEPLWPEWESIEEVSAKRIAIGEAMFAALHQQNPTPPGGLMFMIDRLKVVDAVPSGGTQRRTVRRWDIAATEKTAAGRPDWTVGVKLTQVDSHYYIEDVVRGQWSPAQMKEMLRMTAEADGRAVTIGLPQDPGASGKIVLSDLTAMLAGFVVRGERETGSKVERAMPIASQVEAGNVSMVRAPWNDAFKFELGAFPGGKHDDQVDAFSGAAALLFEKPKLATKYVHIPWGSR